MNIGQVNIHDHKTIGEIIAGADLRDMLEITAFGDAGSLQCTVQIHVPTNTLVFYSESLKGGQCVIKQDAHHGYVTYTEGQEIVLRPSQLQAVHTHIDNILQMAERVVHEARGGEQFPV